LASDDYEGRAPGTPGGRKTVEYLIRQFAELGLEPGGVDGGWTHDVPMIHTLFQGPADLRFVVDVKAQPLQP
jgi:aminopeptidase